MLCFIFLFSLLVALPLPIDGNAAANRDLYRAASTNNLALLNRAVSAGADVNDKSNGGPLRRFFTLLDFAVYFRRVLVNLFHV